MTVKDNPLMQQPQPVILLVHGTFATNASWTQSDSPLCLELRSSITRPEIRKISWSGKNTFDARVQAGHSVVEELLSLDQSAPVSIICHSHGGSAVAYALKSSPEAFENVRSVVFLATPFFGFSVRPGYQALLFAALIALCFFVFQVSYISLTSILTEFFPTFTDQPYAMVSIGFIILLGLSICTLAIWVRRTQIYSTFREAIALADHWDTTLTNFPHPLFVRSMGDEVSLVLSTLQFVATAINKLMNLLANLFERGFSNIRRITNRPLGLFVTLAFIILLIAASGFPAAVAATFGYTPDSWIDTLNPWSKTFHIIEPEFGIADLIARGIYGVILLTLATLFTLLFVSAALTLLAVFLSWLTLAAFGCFSLRLAIATVWSIEPTPEGLHSYLNAGWARDYTTLQKDRQTLQHSEPYSSTAIIHVVVSHISDTLNLT